MKSRVRIIRFAAALAACALPLAYSANASAVTEIQWWHSMTGKLNDKVN
jgi:sn-glycerol 3-phosphate transport system substrate-binding protein